MNSDKVNDTLNTQLINTLCKVIKHNFIIFKVTQLFINIFKRF